MVFTLVYVSAPAADLTPRDLRTLLVQSRRNNTAVHLTGVLIYRPDAFMQMLEGDQADVERVFATIRHDSRHYDVTIVRQRHQPTRNFPNWTMALGTIDPTSSTPVSIEMPPPDGPIPTTDAEATFLRDLLDLLDP